jgi:hypothetical protein
MDIGQEYKAATTGCKLVIGSFSSRRKMTDAQHRIMADTFSADLRSVSGSRSILNTKLPEVKKIGTVINSTKALWKAYSNAYEDGIRLIRTDRVEWMTTLIAKQQEELEQAKTDLWIAWDLVKEEAKVRLASLYCESDYAFDPRTSVYIDISFPAIEPDQRLLKIAPALFAKEQERLAKKFEEAAIAAQQVLEEEFASMLGSLVEKLNGGETEDGKKRVLKQAAVDNVVEFANRFRACSVGSSEELQKLVDQAEQLATGVSAKGMDQASKTSIAEKFSQVKEQLEKSIIVKKERDIE